MSASPMIVAGLARAFTNRGLKVRPFKPQNMSNNAAVDRRWWRDRPGAGGCRRVLHRVPPSVHMNPVSPEAAERCRFAGGRAGPHSRQCAGTRLSGDEAEADDVGHGELREAACRGRSHPRRGGRQRGPRSISGPATSPTWGSRVPPMCRSCSSATSTVAA